MRVYIFGAGASFSYDQSPTGAKPPLAREFFSTYNQLDIAANFEVKIQWILQYVKRTRGVAYDAFGIWNEDIEAFLTEIDQKINAPAAALALEFADRIVADGAFKETVFLFASVLNEIQNGPPCRNYSKVVGQLSEGDVLVTFNWDTLLDRVLWEHGDWYPDDGYGVQFLGLLDGSWRYPARTKSLRRLHKLHGSTNWLMPYHTLHLQTGERMFTMDPGAPESRTVFCYVRSDGEYATSKGRWWGPYEPFSYSYYPPSVPSSTYPESNAWATMPIIIPPVQHKQYELMSGLLEGVWEAVGNSIAKAEELLLIGYSFPVTDVRAIELLRKCLEGRGSILRVKIVNPWPDEIADRLQAIFGGQIEIEKIPISFAEWSLTI